LSLDAIADGPQVLATGIAALFCFRQIVLHTFPLEVTRQGAASSPVLFTVITFAGVRRRRRRIVTVVWLRDCWLLDASFLSEQPQLIGAAPRLALPITA
jgi:hypothetical protein